MQTGLVYLVWIKVKEDLYPCICAGVPDEFVELIERVVFVDQIQLIQDAVAEDTAGKYTTAVKLYCEAVEYFIPAIKCKTLKLQGPVAQSIVSLMSLLRGQLIKCL